MRQYVISLFLKVDIWFYAILSVVYILIIALICLKKKADNAVKNRVVISAGAANLDF